MSDEEMKFAELAETDKIAEALAKAQSEIKPPVKRCKVDFVNKKGQRVKYSYADLADVIAAIKDPLTKNGLALIHQLEYSGTMYGLKSTLMHISGQRVSTWYPMPDPLRGEFGAQEFGSALTYARRYSATALIGIASEEDDDGANAPTIQPPAKPKPAAAPTTKKDGKPAAKPNPNHAPAPQAMIDEIFSMAIEREVQENELIYLVKKGYGFDGPVPPTWVAKEILELLKDESTNAASVMAQAQRVASRREAARMAKENQQ